MRILRKFAVAALAVLFLTALWGCRSHEYYADRAVQKARKFLLEESPELTPEQVYFVQFNRPVFLVGPIFDRVDTNWGRKQICVAWRIPGCATDYLVYGSDDGDLYNWYPQRLIRKNFEVFALPLNGAMQIARAYATTDFYDQLTVEQFNFVRFSFPSVIESDFTLVDNPDGNLPPEAVAENAARTASATQLTLVWKLPDSSDSIFFCGTGAPDLSGWKLNFAGIAPNAQIEAATLKILKTPEEAQTPIIVPSEEKQP